MGQTKSLVGKQGNTELTTQEKARQDWLREQRGVQNTNKTTPATSPRMAGSRGGLFQFNPMFAMMGGGRGTARIRGGGGRSRPFRDQATRDWIDEQRGVKYERTEKDKSARSMRDLFGLRTTQDRQRYQDRNAWIDEQIRKSNEEKEAKRISEENQPLTQEGRRGYLNKEVEERKNIWDDD